MATIKDVAKAAKVSIATVSAAFNEFGSVRAETKRRIWAAAAAVGYSPNAIARSLRLGRSRLIGVVVADIANPFCATVVRVVEDRAIAAGYSIIVCNSDEDEQRSFDILAQLRAQQVAGIILTPIGHSPDFIKLLESPIFRPTSPWISACLGSLAISSASTTARPRGWWWNICYGSVIVGSPSSPGRKAFGLRRSVSMRR